MPLVLRQMLLAALFMACMIALLAMIGNTLTLAHAEKLQSAGSTTLLMVFLGIPYLLPSIIASSRRHRNGWGILILNLLLGWTIIGWIAALIWSVYRSPSDR